MKIRTIALAAGVLASTLVLAGCAQGSMEGMPGMGGTEPSPTELAVEFNAADEMFATMMIPHHEQAIEMSNIILGKDGIDERVVALAERIKAAQTPEIETMISWLDAWGADSSMGGMEGMGGTGMMSDDDMAALDAAQGVDASRLFLEQMIAHHQGAIDMAQTEVDNGINPDAVALAGKIIEDQTAEIAEIQQLLTQL